MNVARIIVDGAEFVVDEHNVVSTGKLQMTVRPDYVDFWNQGGPDNFGNGKWPTEPVFATRLNIVCPGKVPQLHQFQMCRKEPDGSWTIFDEQSFRPFHHRWADPSRPWYARSKTEYMIDGGDHLYIRLVDDDDQLEADFAPAQADVARARRIADIDSERDGDPRLLRLLDLYRFTASSWARGAKVRDFGWWSIPENWIYQNTSRSIEEVRGVYASGDIVSPSEGSCNLAYDHGMWPLVRWLLGRTDGSSLLFGLTLVRQQVAHGIIDTATPRNPCYQRGWFRGEKSGLRRGETVGTFPNKQFASSIAVAASLCPGDAFIQHGATVVAEGLLQTDLATWWNGAGGGRAIGHVLQNMLDFYRLTDNEAFLVRAEAFINWVFQKNAKNIGATALWFDNSLRRGWNAVWEEAKAHALIRKWQNLGVGEQHRQHLDDMIGWLLERGSEVVGPGYRRVALEVSTTDPLVRKFSLANPPRVGEEKWNASFWAQLPQSTERDWAVAYTLSQIPAQVSVTWGSAGPAWIKQIPQLCGILRR